MIRHGPAVIEVRMLHGPPRPVRVVSVTGDIDRSNESALVDTLSHGRAVSRAAVGLGPVESPSADAATVIDLRAAAFVSVGALTRLNAHGRRTGRPVRIVLDPHAPLGRAVHRVIAVLGHHLGLHPSLEPGIAVYRDIADAVLTEVTVLD